MNFLLLTCMGVHRVVCSCMCIYLFLRMRAHVVYGHSHVCWRPGDGSSRLVTGSLDRTVRVWDISSSHTASDVISIRPGSATTSREWLQLCYCVSIRFPLCIVFRRLH